jgi:hypothetical protein
MMFTPNTSATTGTSRSNGGDESPTGDIIANKIFVGGLRYATGHDALRSYFEQFGEVEAAQVIFNRDTKKSRGFGFVIFRDSSSVDKVLAHQNVAAPVIDGKQVEVKTCVARQDMTGGVGSVLGGMMNDPETTAEYGAEPGRCDGGLGGGAEADMDEAEDPGFEFWFWLNSRSSGESVFFLGTANLDSTLRLSTTW